MEYYILKLYQSEKEKNPNVEQGFSRFQPKIKRIIISCLIIVFLSCFGMIATMFLFPHIVIYLLQILVCTIALFILFMIDNNDQKTNIDLYVDSHKQKIDILFNLLSTEFQINTKEKVEALIYIYQNYIDKRNKEEETRNKIILTIFSSFAGVLSISLVNMETIGLDFTSWLYIAVFLLILVGCAGIWIYSYSLFDSLKKKYEIMIKDLNDLLIMKY